MEAPATVHIASEVGRLRRVICHEPGPELAAVTPSNRAAYLFDDLLDLEAARSEHRRFKAVLDRFTEVLEVSHLLADVLERAEARDFVLARAGEGVREWAAEVGATELARSFIEGRRARAAVGRRASIAELVHEAGYELPPLPNLFFTRDAAAVARERVLVAAMAHEVRWTEELIMRALFTFHPLLGNRGFLYDGTRERRVSTSIEGGDLHVLREDLFLVGLSERTSATGIDTLAQALFEEGGARDLLVVLLPKHRTAIHLDMVFTMIDRDMCCVFGPYFSGPTRLPIVRLTRGAESVREMPDLFSALAELGLPLEPIPCGGERRTQQEREQWGSATNMVAVGPGQLIAYERNEETLAALERHGSFRIVPAVAFLTGDEPVGADERFVITFRGSELVRGGGGPRCMTLPIIREAVE